MKKAMRLILAGVAEHDACAAQEPEQEDGEAVLSS